jgi:AcrR family transcriptional regulator
MPVSRRTQEQRSSETRGRLAKAAFDLIRSDGYASFRVAAVGKAADVSQGGQLHHFPTKDAMTIAAIEYAIERAEKKTRANLATYVPGADAVDAIAADSRDYYFSESFNVAMDVVKSASSNATLRRSIARMHRQYRTFAEESWHRILRDQGWAEDDAHDLVAMTASLVRGFAIRSMMRHDQAEIDRLMARWKRMVYATFPTPQDSQPRTNGR